jgi:hypothetical protein
MRQFLIWLLFSFYLTATAQCGKERWNVKTLSDKDTLKVDFTHVIKTTVNTQSILPKPLKIPKNMPRQNTECNVYSIDCYIIEYKKESDKDIHIVLRDLKTNATMVAEIPSPKCPEVQNTSRYKKFDELYSWFTYNVGKPTSKFKTLPRPLKVRITGVGFYDFIHGQHGMAPNGREIHPVLSIKIIN